MTAGMGEKLVGADIVCGRGDMGVNVRGCGTGRDINGVRANGFCGSSAGFSVLSAICSEGCVFSSARAAGEIVGDIGR